MWNPIKLKHLGLCCCVWSIHPMGFLNIQTFEFTPSKHFCDSTFCEFPFFYIRPQNRLHFYTPCQVLVINLDKTSSMAKFSWSFVRWAMLQTVNWVYFTQWNDAEHSTADNASSVPYYLQCHITRTNPMLILTAHNWQKWKSRFLTRHCHNIHRVGSVGLSISNYTLKITIFVNVKLGAISWNFDILPKTAKNARPIAHMCTCKR